MAMAVTNAVRTGRRLKANGSHPARPSVREVCLLGVARPLTAGDRLTWSGRSYRVEASHPGYAHLAAEPAEAVAG